MIRECHDAGSKSTPVSVHLSETEIPSPRLTSFHGFESKESIQILAIVSRNFPAADSFKCDGGQVLRVVLADVGRMSADPRPELGNSAPSGCPKYAN